MNAGSGPAPTIDELLRLGEIGLEQGLWSDAERYYQQALVLDPECMSALLGMARAARDPAAARAWLARAEALSRADERVAEVVASMAGRDEPSQRHPRTSTQGATHRRRWMWAVPVAAILLLGLAWWALMRGREPAPLMIATTIPSYAQTALALPTDTPLADPTPPAVDGRARAQRATALILAPVEGEDKVSRGSGALVDASGLVLTSLHVLEREPGVGINSMGWAVVGFASSPQREPDAWFVAMLVAEKRNADLAVLAIVADAIGGDPAIGLDPILWGDADTLQPGQEIVGLGFPALGGDTLTYAAGTVAGYASTEDGVAMAKTEANLLPGSSGGPVIDAEGRLMGVISTAYTDAQSHGRLSYCVLESEARDLIRKARRIDPSEPDLTWIVSQAQRVINERQ